jgi:hydroxyacylglutathione hydrolase
MSENLEIVPVRAFQDNYIWVMRRGGDAAVVDPGDARPVLEYLTATKLRLVAIINTHHHNDHVGGNAGLLERFKVPVYGPGREQIPTLTQRLNEGDSIRVPELDIEFTVLDIPGHTAGHIAFFGAGVLFCGDTLFACGCGKLFEGTPAQMYASLSKLARLPDATRVYCGHEYTLSNIKFAKAADPLNEKLLALEATARRLREQDLPTLPSTIGMEKLTNPFLRCSEPAVIESASKAAGRPLDDPVSVLAAIREWKNRF